MKLSRNRAGYYIREGITSIFTHGMMSFASSCIIVAFLVIMGSFSLLALNVNGIIGELEDENVVLAYVDESLSYEEARALEPAILATDNVSSASFISRDDALASFLGRYEDKEPFSDITAKDLRDRYTVYLDDVALTGETQESLKNIRGIDTVNANLKIAQGLVTLRNIVSGVSVVIVAILLAISLFIMSNTIKLATFERREEIAIMRMVGATYSFIRWPFIYEGFILGISGAVVAFLVQWAMYSAVASRVISVGISLVTVIPFSSVSIQLFIVFIAIGFAVGVGGSGLALRKYLKV